MKKIIIFTIFCAILFSCSSDVDNSNKQLLVRIENLSGEWYIKDVINPDGTKTPYVNICPPNINYVVFKTYHSIDYFQSINCNETYSYESCYDFYFMGNVITGCSTLFDGTISSLTATKMQIDYNETRSFPYLDNGLSNAIGITLVRKE